MFNCIPLGEKQRVSLIAAIGLNANLAEHAIVHPQSVIKNASKAYLATTLLPKFKAGTTLILDKWTVHHGADVKEFVESYDCKFFYLPTHSHDL